VKLSWVEIRHGTRGAGQWSAVYNTARRGYTVRGEVGGGGGVGGGRRGGLIQGV
jgi:hypothetical protein